MTGWMRNAEGYYDPTAGNAMKNIEEERRATMGIKRGEIFYIKRGYYTGSEQEAGRPGVVVSNDKNNESSGTVEVVYLTTAPKKDLPTHVTIHSTGRDSTALCEQISTVSVERLGDYICDATEAEMMNIEIAMLISLDMDVGEVKEKVIEVVKEVPVETIREVKVDRSSEVESLREELARMQGKYEMMQEMYDSLLTRCLRAG